MDLKMYSSLFAHCNTTIKNAHHCPSHDRMAASRSRARDAMLFLFVVAWRDLASLVAVNLCRHRFLRYNVPRYTCCRYLTINIAYCCHPLMDSIFFFDCCVLASCYGRITVVAPRQYDCFPQHQNMLCCYVFAMIDMLSHTITSLPFGI